MSSASSNNSKRVRQAIQGSDMSESPSPPKPDVAQTPAVPSSNEKTASKRGALSLPHHRSHSMDNRPVDPSPIQVSHTVSMAGQRPIGVSENTGPVRFDPSRTILNRPIAPNATAADDALLEYLD